MSETAILFAKPGAVRPSDKGALRKVGIIVVEVESLDDVRLVRPALEGSQLPESELLRAYATALQQGQDNGTKVAFANAVGAVLRSKDPQP